MSSSLPVVRQIAWRAFVPQLLVMGAFLLGGHATGLPHPELWAFASYLVLGFVLRRFVSEHHRRGIRLFRQERFADAVPCFQQSYEFFSRHPWVDRYRALTLLSASRISYREMALLNTAFCLSQVGDRERAIVTYERVLLEYPDSKIAQTSLRLLAPSPPIETASTAPAV